MIGCMTTVPPVVLLREQLRRAGFEDPELRRLVRDGELSAVRRGAYVEGAVPGAAELRHLAAVDAASRQLAPGAVLSHVSAALVHGFAVWNVPLGRVHATRDRRTGGRVDPSVHVRAAPVDADEREVVGGLLVTGRARTVADVLRTVPFEQGVVVADSALAAGVPRHDLRAAVARQKGWPGVPAARRALAFADGRSASVGESRSRVAIHRAGLPPPELQHEIRDRWGRHVGTVDFWWASAALAGEFDGLVKYGRLLRPGQTAAGAVVAEKIREDRLRDEGAGVTRWTWTDLAPFTPTAARIRHRLGRPPRG